ncbi:isochorismate synthase [Leeuwenhoekiella aestuarii]|uniref:Isochorismate synthase n=1 Tax=Leeuwenhoekiella aestuarii TaxID=2249426 RepID=A0A4Q0NXF0_9FLAO|nr:chorismate-binding protein [Leeuwenhoekiella aestuarii]RXG16253.1 isochorismate synthase [Leeuwenhoekiella aestuarii]RXG16946.1 isochorismate synthase [Leeuwenhoekiella aestuarii]
MTTEDLFSKANAQYAKNLPFVLYRKPEADLLNGLFQEDDFLHKVETFEETGFVFSPFDKDKTGILIPGIPEVTTDYIEEKASLRSTIIKTESAAEAAHIQLVEKALAAIQNSVLQKVVLSREQSQEIENVNPITIFKRLLFNYKTAFVYIWHHPQVGTWLGATPETLLSLRGRKFETMALAGTQKFTGSVAVTWGDKEIYEQQLVTDEIITNLQSFDLRSLHVGDRETHQAGTLLHLRTLISGTFNTEGQNLKSLLKALHPTPAVCGLPRDLAKDFIMQEENYDRAFYTGFLGELNILRDTSKKRSRRNVENLAYKTLKNETKLFVNLRCMQYTDSKALIYIGGGITVASNPKLEWQETVNKAQTIASAL